MTETETTSCCGPTCCTPPGVTVKEAVQAKYGAAARNVKSHKASCCTTAKQDPISSDLYDEAEKSGLPAEAVLASLGCGNPTALAELNAGEGVLDLGSGGGIDVLLPAKRVGPPGKASTLERTDEFIDLAHGNNLKRGPDNSVFMHDIFEGVPLP